MSFRLDRKDSSLSFEMTQGMPTLNLFLNSSNFSEFFESYLLATLHKQNPLEPASFNF